MTVDCMQLVHWFHWVGVWVYLFGITTSSSCNVVASPQQEVEMRNSELERRILNTEQTLSNSLEDRDRMDTELQRAIEILDIKIFDLNDLRQSLVKLVDK